MATASSLFLLPACQKPQPNVYNVQKVRVEAAAFNNNSGEEPNVVRAQISFYDPDNQPTRAVGRLTLRLYRLDAMRNRGQQIAATTIEIGEDDTVDGTTVRYVSYGDFTPANSDLGMLEVTLESPGGNKVTGIDSVIALGRLSQSLPGLP